MTLFSYVSLRFSWFWTCFLGGRKRLTNVTVTRTSTCDHLGNQFKLTETTGKPVHKLCHVFNLFSYVSVRFLWFWTCVLGGWKWLRNVAQTRTSTCDHLVNKFKITESTWKLVHKWCQFRLFSYVSMWFLWFWTCFLSDRNALPILHKHERAHSTTYEIT